MSVPEIILVGASVRAAAASALRAGLRPWCLDLFCDSDLRAIAPAYRCPPGEYPQGLLPLFRQSPPVPWIYTGGLENHPNLIREMAELRPLWGNGPNELALVRSPFRVARLLDEEGLPYLEVQHADSGTVKQDVIAWRQPNPSGVTRWLRKPLRSAGGHGIGFADESPASEDLADPAYYFQQFIEGLSYSAVFLAQPPDQARLIGVTRQLVGESALNAGPFQYCGNVGPIELDEQPVHTLKRIGEVLTKGCQLRGLLGIDFILKNNEPWLVEVNPRYTASVEVLEFALRRSLLALHRSVFDPDAPSVSVSAEYAQPFVAKLVWYAKRRFVYPTGESIIPSEFEPVVPFCMPLFADIPNPGEVIEERWPICTILTGDHTLNRCVSSASKIAAELARLPLLGGG